jgi:hypothetical protein
VVLYVGKYLFNCANKNRMRTDRLDRKNRGAPYLATRHISDSRLPNVVPQRPETKPRVRNILRRARALEWRDRKPAMLQD